jgi:hypothetical protein
LSNPIKHINTREEVAKAANVSEGTLDKVKTVLAKGTEEQKQAMRSGEESVNRIHSQIPTMERKEKENQLGRRNLNPDQMSLIRGRIYNRLKKQGFKGNQYSESGKDQIDTKQNTAEILAEKHGVSRATIEREGRTYSNRGKHWLISKFCFIQDLGVDLNIFPIAQYLSKGL